MLDSADIIGTRHGVYEVIYKCPYKSNDGHKIFRMRCTKCGYERDCQARHMVKLPQECPHLDAAGIPWTSYHREMWRSVRLYQIYQGMVHRCYNRQNADYKWYGKRGITICNEWLQSPLEFEKWAFTHGYQDDLTIDRIDSNANYSPENCRWVSNSDNAKYKSSTNILEVDGIALTGHEWSEKLQIGTNTISMMLRTYSTEEVKSFIRERLKDSSATRQGRQTWMSTYNII